ncbi:hypothetical protein J22TS1_48820 [Siminovitchia terrae]|uniref:sce7725 family protein n=1 Tax=Siminovitchia terrae TaxID=1914933 RepID=UPI001B067C1A|nr:sce7725 family protein [Siminovitchia terrae]GIN93831.1 hypothetical protein J22TS1_48820 [Siminovitchia terrae]
MYLPYLRGKQFELIALRELVEEALISDRVVPIIEPIKLTSTLKTTLKKFVELQKKIGIVLNPTVGDFVNEYKNGEKDKAFEELLASEYIIKAYIMNENTNDDLKWLKDLGYEPSELLVINTDSNHIAQYKSAFERVIPQYTLIPDNTLCRRSVTAGKVLFEDRFVKEVRNSDYKDRDIFFSADHLYYQSEDYVGFSDYSIIGDGFNETGFAPYAVAIHIVYFDEENHLKVKSFVSDSNDDIRDPARKYGQALAYLVPWAQKRGEDTKAIRRFIEHQQNGTYPGLGTIKKLSIMHHLELMSQYLEVEMVK